MAGGRRAVYDPVTGEIYAQAAESDAEDIDAACVAAAAAFLEWGGTTPAERSAAMLEAAALIEANADELTRIEVADTGKPYVATREDELPPIIDQIRFFAGACRVMSGLATGDYMAAHDVGHPTRACRRVRADHPLELPVDDGRVEVGSSHRRRQHRRLEAVRVDTGLDGADGRAAGRGLSARRAQRRVRWSRDGRSTGAPPGGGHGVADGEPEGRPAGGPGRGRATDPGPSGTRWQCAGRDLRRHRCDGHGGSGGRRGVLQRRSGLHRRHPGPGRAFRL